MENDLTLRQIKQSLLLEEPVTEGYELVDGKLLYKDRLVIPPRAPFIQRLLVEYHNSSNWQPFGGA